MSIKCKLQFYLQSYSLVRKFKSLRCRLRGDINMNKNIFEPHDSLIQHLFGKSISNINDGMYRDVKFIYKDYKPKIYVSDLVGEDYLNKWVPSVPVIITTQTGTGKNYFIGEKIVANIITQNRRNKGKLNAKILILSNRVALNMQTKLHFADIIDKYSGADAQKYLPKLKEMTVEEKNRYHDFGAIQIFSYHQIWFHIMTNKTPLEYNFDFVIFDESHFFTQDAIFNAHTDEILQRLIPACSGAVRVYLSATFEDVAHLIFKYENYTSRPLDKDRPFGYRCGELIENFPEISLAQRYSYEEFDHPQITYTTKSNPQNTYRPFWGYSAVIYDFERNYDYIEVQTLPIGKEKNFKGKYQSLIQKIKETNVLEKWIVFISNKDEGEALARYLNDDENIPTAFVCMESKSQSRGNYKAYQNIIENSKFNERVLITTSVLDNGVNIKDPTVEHVAIFNLERTNFLQMLGRVRRYDDMKLQLYFPEYLVTNLQNQLKENFKGLLKRLKFDSMKPIERAFFLENLLSGTGFGVKNFRYSNIRYNEFSLTKLAITINSLKNFLRYFDPQFKIEFEEDTKIRQTFNDAKTLYEDINKNNDYLAREVDKALNESVNPVYNQIKLPAHWNSESDFSVIKQECIEMLKELDNANNDDFDFNDFLYLMRYLDVTERLNESINEKKKLIANSNSTNKSQSFGELDDKILRLKKKQEKYFKLFNLLNEKNKPICPNSPTFERLLWLEKFDVDFEKVSSGGIETNLKILNKYFESNKLSHKIIDELKSKLYGVSQHNNIVRHSGIKPPKNDSDEKNVEIWNVIQKVCKFCTGKEIKQVKKLNDFFACRDIPFRFITAQLRGNDEGKSTFWLIEKINKTEKISLP